MRLRGDYELDLSFQRGCGQNIESNGVIYCLHLFSLGYKPKLGLTGSGVKEKVASANVAVYVHMMYTGTKRQWDEDRHGKSKDEKDENEAGGDSKVVG